MANKDFEVTGGKYEAPACGDIEDSSGGPGYTPTLVFGVYLLYTVFILLFFVKLGHRVPLWALVLLGTLTWFAATEALEVLAKRAGREHTA